MAKTNFPYFDVAASSIKNYDRTRIDGNFMERLKPKTFWFL